MEEYFVIEQLNPSDVPESEMSQFEETHPLEIIEVLDNKEEVAEEEGVLIQKFVSGEVEFDDLYTKLEPPEVDEDEEFENEISQAENNEEQPTTSSRSNVTKYNEQNWQSFISDKDEKPKRSVAGIRRRSMLNSALNCLMGEANLSLARNRPKLAEKICLEIIRQNPFAPEPFLTLAHIFETSDPYRALNYLTVACHLNPHDRDNWITIAEAHLQLGNPLKARLILTKATKVLPKDYDLRLRKARITEGMNLKTKAMFIYLRAISLIPAEIGELCLSVAEKVARFFYCARRFNLSLLALDEAYKICAHLFSGETLILYLELLTYNKQYEQVLSCLEEREGIDFKIKRNQQTRIITSCEIPDNVHANFRSKVYVSLIHLQSENLMRYLVGNAHDHIPVVIDRLNEYVDIAEALMEKHKYAETLELLRPIIDKENFECPAFIWMRQAECLRHLNRTNEAIDSYKRVVELTPLCYDAKFTLSALLKQQRRYAEAIKVLEQPTGGSVQPINGRLLYERCMMLLEVNRLDEFFDAGCLLLGRYSRKLLNREEMFTAANGGGFYNPEGIKAILRMRNLTYSDADKAMEEYNTPIQEDSDLTLDEEYELFLTMIRVADDNQRYSDAERVCFSMVTTKRFQKFHAELERIILLACYFNGDYMIAFSFLRDMLSKNTHSVPLWNILSLIIQKGHEMRYHRFLTRLLNREPHLREMNVITAHYHLYCTTYKYALNLYVPIYRDHPTPLVALCISSIFVQFSQQRNIQHKPTAMAHALAFIIQYAELRSGASIDSPEFLNSPCLQEIYYNFGRIYHQSSMLEYAIKYYELALEVKHPMIDQHAETIDLKREIAMNLHSIFRASGNYLEARDLLYKYIIV